jgi:transposase InsO family protein
VEEEMEVRSVIQQIALEHRRRYGYRRISAELRRRGMLVNHKRVARIMREDNLLAVQPRQFVLTTDSNHELEVYLNLARRMKLTGIDQLWVADITYVRLRAEFVYLAVILDSFSRKVVGWALERTITSRLAIAALQQAIRERQPRPGLVHHSDRGVQYASGEYVAVLNQHQMIPSMSRPANPYDNASCESFMKTLKREEIYANRYENLEDLRANVEIFIEQYYNKQRLHSALGYRSPDECTALFPPCRRGCSTSARPAPPFWELEIAPRRGAYDRRDHHLADAWQKSNPKLFQKRPRAGRVERLPAPGASLKLRRPFHLE